MAYAHCNITLILPAYNETQTICSTLRDVTAYFKRRNWKYQIIVSADGDDGTRERAREFGQHDDSVEVIGEPFRRGKGRGIRDAVRLAVGDVVGFADADNKVPIEELGKLEPWFDCRQDYDIVIGSRALKDSRMERKPPWYRLIGSRGFYYFMHAVVGMPGIEDTQCGFKFFRREAAQDLFALQRIDGYMFDVEVLALAQRLGYRIKEVPVRWRDDGDTRLRLVMGNIQNALDVFKIRWYCARLNPAEATVRARAANS